MKRARAAWFVGLAAAMAAMAGLAQERQYSVPLFGAVQSERVGFVRFVNRSGAAGAATIHAIDDAGQRRGR